jgi:hypothetical protein
MHTAEPASVRPTNAAELCDDTPAVGVRRALTGGGTHGNERLTSITGALLIVLLAVLGITILRIGQLIWLHLFVGLALLGPLAVKMASTGYRFTRYYTGNPAYRTKGPPKRMMRLSAPLVVVSTVLVFLSGVLLLILGPSARGQYLLLHKASFVVWLAVATLHVLGHLPQLTRSLRAARADGELLGSAPGAAGRWLAIVGGLVAGVVLAVALVPDFAPWTAQAVISRGH